ncbi:MAG TPA: hypothetical protein VFA89_11450 [Terriglobales bacterium]|nr:hypothetical protein [Terriglobales bacterium]
MKKDMNPDELVAGYRAFGMRKRDAILQARLYRRASAPQDQRVTFCVDAETLADLRAAAQEKNRTLGEELRARLRIAEGTIEDERAGRERAMKRAAKFNPMAEVETRCSTNS